METNLIVILFVAATIILTVFAQFQSYRTSIANRDAANAEHIDELETTNTSLNERIGSKDLTIDHLREVIEELRFRTIKLELQNDSFRHAMEQRGIFVPPAPINLNVSQIGQDAKVGQQGIGKEIGQDVGKSVDQATSHPSQTPSQNTGQAPFRGIEHNDNK